MLLPLWRKYADVNIALADQAMISGANFVTAILLARFLGLNEFGVYTLAFLGIELLHTFQHSIIVAPMMSLLPKVDARDKRQYLDALIVGQLLFTVVILGLALAVIATVGWFDKNWQGNGLLWPFAAAVVGCQLQMYLRRHLFSTGANWAAMLCDMLRYPVQIGVLAYFLTTTNMDADSALYVVGGCAGFATVVALGFMRPLTVSVAFFRATVVRHWQFSRWYLASELMRWSTGQLYVVMTGTLLGPAAVGAMRATQNLVAACHILKLGLENVVPIRASEHFQNGRFPPLVSYLKRVSFLGGGAVVLFLIVVALDPKLWLHLIYGKMYGEYSYLVLWWAMIYLVNFFHTPLYFGLRAIEDTQAIFRSQALMALWTVISVYPLIMHVGLAGSMAGILVADVAQLGLLAYGFSRHLQPHAKAGLH